MIYDCFPFLNELDVLEIRLNTLNSVVDFFVIVESTHTFQKNPKPLYFAENKARFAEFLPKIIHVVDDSMPLNGDTWITYAHQLNCIHQGLKNAREDDIVSISDLDEIFNPLMYKELIYPLEIIFPAMKVFYYFLNCHTGNAVWDCGFITTRGAIKDLDIYKTRMRKTLEGQQVLNGGWHFSYMGGVDTIIEKLQSFSHVEYNKPDFLDRKRICEYIEQRLSIFEPLGTPSMDIIPIDESFPIFIRENLNKYVAMGWIL